MDDDYTRKEAVYFLTMNIASLGMVGLGVLCSAVQDAQWPFWAGLIGALVIGYQANKVERLRDERIARARERAEKARDQAEHAAYWREEDERRGRERAAFDYEQNFGPEATEKRYGRGFMNKLRGTQDWAEWKGEEERYDTEVKEWEAQGSPGPFWEWQMERRMHEETEAPSP